MKKHRNQNRVIKEIRNRIDSDSELDFDFLKTERYFNFQIEDWYGDKLSTKGKSRKFIVQNLFSIYVRWKAQLEKLDKPFYLSIWLHEPRLLKSEVVCAIQDKISYYENDVFILSEKTNKLDENNYGKLSDEFAKLNWMRNVDFEPFYDWEINWPKEQYELANEYYSDQRFFKKLLSKNIRITENENGKTYYDLVGDIWVSYEK